VLSIKLCFGLGSGLEMKKIVQSSNKLDLSVAQIGADQSESLATSVSKDQYVKPTLVAYGDVRDITFGPSPGGFESGSTTFCDRTNPGSCPF
jgi:hypothetical protein